MPSRVMSCDFSLRAGRSLTPARRRSGLGRRGADGGAYVRRADDDGPRADFCTCVTNGPHTWRGRAVDR
jgi:hypothetical protein